MEAIEVSGPAHVSPKLQGSVSTGIVYAYRTREVLHRFVTLWKVKLTLCF